ncbi:MAG: TetR family transcriptional regulator [Rhodospirillaceae bacterium]|nr:TetR family transcriptional regulator [Rhodospirillaceae bacterium]
MAKSRAKSKSSRAKPVDPVERIFAGAMEVAERIGWRRAALADIADAAKMSLAELRRHFADKAAILRGMVDEADRKVLDGANGPDPESAARDRLFDVLMRRFDALRPYRAGLAVVAREGGGGVVEAICGARRLLRSMEWMLEAAGIGSGGWAGALRAKGLAVVYGATFATWLRDDSEDMAKTMAALDRNLGRAERFANSFAFRRPSAPGRDGGARGDEEGAAA